MCFVTPPTSVDLFDLRHTVCMRRMVYDYWDLVPTRDSRRGADGNLRIFWEVGVRSIGRARRRWQRAQISPIPEEVGPFALTGGTVLKIPSDD